MATIGYTLSMDYDLDPRAYVRMAARLRRQISAGTFAPAAPVPSITVLGEQYGHARQTCAKALQALAAEGLLVRIPGLGYHVAQRPVRGLPGLAGGCILSLRPGPRTAAGHRDRSGQSRCDEQGLLLRRQQFAGHFRRASTISGRACHIS